MPKEEKLQFSDLRKAFDNQYCVVNSISDGKMSGWLIDGAKHAE